MVARLAALCCDQEATRHRCSSMTRFLIVNADYPGFLDVLYSQHPGLEAAMSDEQMRTRTASLFGVADFYPRNLARLGHPALEVYLNNRFLQEAWAREHRPEECVERALRTRGAAAGRCSLAHP